MLTYHYNKREGKAYIYDGDLRIKTLVVTEPYLLNLMAHVSLEDIIRLPHKVLTPEHLIPLYTRGIVA